MRELLHECLNKKTFIVYSRVSLRNVTQHAAKYDAFMFVLFTEEETYATHLQFATIFRFLIQRTSFYFDNISLTVERC